MKYLFTIVLSLLQLQTFGQNTDPSEVIKSFNGVVKTTHYDAANNVIYVGGDFNAYDPLLSNGAWVHPTTGVENRSFPAVNGAILACAPDGNGGWFIGGSFTVVGGLTRNRLAQIDATGQVTAFNSAGTTNGNINCMKVSNGTLVVGGAFTLINGQSRSRLASFTVSSGSINSWNPAPNGEVNAVEISGNTVYVGGNFTSIGVGFPARNRIAAVDITTSEAAPWNPDANGVVTDLRLAASTLYVAGSFTQIGGQTRNYLAALSTITGLATSWNPEPDNVPNKLVSSGTTLFVGGLFNSISGQSRTNLCSFNLGTGNLTAWNPPEPLNKSVTALELNGTTLYVGRSLNFDDLDQSVVAYNTSTGSLLPWSVAISTTVSQKVVKTIGHDGTQVMIGGIFRYIGGDRRERAAAVNASTGALLPWNPTVLGTVNTIVKSGSVVYLGGKFSKVNNDNRANLAAVNSTTGTTTAWTADVTGPGAEVSELLLDGTTLYVAGQFTTVGGQARSNIAATNASTGVVTTWNPSADNRVGALAMVDNTLYCGGAFTTIGGQSRNRLAALSVSTGLATSWNPNANDEVYDLAIQGDYVYASGNFLQLSGQAHEKLRAIHKTSGAISSWNPNVTSGSIYSIFPHGGNLYLAGLFGIGGGGFITFTAVDLSTGVPGWYAISNPVQTGRVANTILVIADGVFAGGRFVVPDVNAPVARENFARWDFCALPAQPGSISGSATVCQGTAQTYSVAAVGGATSYTWTLPSGWSGSSTTNSINATAGSAGGTISVTANNACGSSPARTLAVTVNTIPTQPGTISGNATVCQGTAQTYSVAAVGGATSYTWTLPSGWSGSSTTNSINATAGSAGGTISVTANNACGSSPARTLAVTVNTIPTQPGTISGNATVCQGTAQTYSVAAVGGATSYTWTLPSGWSGSSTTNSINATAGSAGGTISVTANNTCGSGPARTLAVTVNTIPTQPGTISGNATVCQGTAQTYSVDAVGGATSYTWTLPSGWSGTSTTNSINATAGSSGGTISVTANNACGSSPARTLAVTVNTIPAQPGTISGNATVCQGSAQTYSVAAVGGATSYTWSLPSGWSGSSTTNSINVTAGSTGGTISVTANNACGSSPARTLAVTTTTVPAQPSTITGSTTVCTGTAQPYSVTNVTGVTYTWDAPGGTITGSGSSISVTWNTPGARTLTVTPSNSCGNGTARTLAVTVNDGTPPAQPSPITGTNPANINSTHTYSVTNVGGVTYAWTLSGGGTISGSGNSISITWNVAGTFTLTCTPSTSCGSGSARTLSVTVNKLNQTITFGALAASTFGDNPFTLTATASSGLPVSYTSSNPAVATVSGSTVTIVGAGSTTITASQPGNDVYNAATPVNQNLTVNKASQTITFGPLPEKSLGDPPFALTATASSGLPVSYTSSNTAVATISGITVTIVGVGSTIITASQAGNTNYNAAPSVPQTLTVSTVTRVIALSGNLAFGDVIVGVPAQRILTISNTGNSTLTISNISYPTGFSGNHTTGTIPAGGSLPVTITFSPTQLQVFSGQITVTSDATSGNNQISVSGSGISITSVDPSVTRVTDIYPNPGNGLFNISVEGVDLSLPDGLLVFDHTGRTLKVKITPQIEPGKYLLDLVELPNGLYYVALPGQSKSVKRILKVN